MLQKSAIKHTTELNRQLDTYPWSIRSTPPGPIIAGCPGPIGPPIGCPPGPKGLPGGIPYWGPPKGGPGEGKCGFPPPGGAKGGPDDPGRLTNCGAPPDGETNGLGPGPLKGGPELFGGGGNPELGGGPGPGVEDPLGAGEALYWGVADPGGGPW